MIDSKFLQAGCSDCLFCSQISSYLGGVCGLRIQIQQRSELCSVMLPKSVNCAEKEFAEDSKMFEETE